MEISTPMSTRDKTKQRSIWRCQYCSHWGHVSATTSERKLCIRGFETQLWTLVNKPMA